MNSPTSEESPPLRVLYLVSLFPCWSETFIVREIRALVARGVDVRILSLKHPYEKLVHPQAQQLLDRVTYPVRRGQAIINMARELAAAPSVHARVLARIVRGLIGSPVCLAKTLVTWWRTVAVAPRLRQQRPDLLHAHWATYPSTAAWILSESLGVPFSFTSHAHDIFAEDQLLRAKLARARFAVTISDFNRESLRKRFGEGAVHDLYVIRCGVSLEEFEYRPGGREQGYILSVGRLEEVKGFPYLVTACRILRDRGIAVRCDIVGDGRQRRELESWIAREGLHEVVRLRGAMGQREVSELLYRASVFALACVVTDRGDRDGVPVVLMEAMAVGLPVISTKISGIPELVEDDVNGRLVHARDALALADAISALLNDSDLRGRFVAQGRETIERQFNVEREAERLLRCFERAIGRTPSRSGV